MAKNFDTGRLARRKSEDDRTFQLGGETFVIRPGIRPEALAPYDDIGTETTTAQVLEIVDDLMETLISPDDGAHERYRAVRANEVDPIELPDLLDVVQWAVEVYTDRPTGRPSVSEAGSTSTGTNSTDDSSSKDSQAALPVLA